MGVGKVVVVVRNGWTQQQNANLQIQVCWEYPILSQLWNLPPLHRKITIAWLWAMAQPGGLVLDSHLTIRTDHVSRDRQALNCWSIVGWWPLRINDVEMTTAMGDPLCERFHHCIENILVETVLPLKFFFYKWWSFRSWSRAADILFWLAIWEIRGEI